MTPSTPSTRDPFYTTPAYSWSYNGAGELVQADDTTAGNDRAYQYDGIGNREKTVNGLLAALPGTANYVANSLNQYTTANGIILPTTPVPSPYDADGNHTHGPLPVATGNATLLWDAENRLITVTRADATIIYYAYDYLSRRISKQVGAATAIHYIYDGWNIITEYTGTTLAKSYTWGMDLSGSMQGAGGVGGLLAVKEGASSYYPTYDGNGNVSEYLNSSNAVQAHYEYDAFGNTTASSGAKVNDFSHRFSTKPLDAETGLYYYGYRYYDPTTGRWPSRDPIEELGGLNLYGFVNNGGINKWDYLGNYCDGTQVGPAELISDWKMVEFDWEIINATGSFLITDLYMTFEATCKVCCRCVDDSITHRAHKRRDGSHVEVHYSGNVVGGGPLVPVPSSFLVADLIGIVLNQFVGEVLGNAALIFTEGSWEDIQNDIADTAPTGCDQGSWVLGTGLFDIPITNPCFN